MTDEAWALDASNGDVLIHTGVAGRAARLGHRLTIAVTSWRATVSWAGGVPSAVEFVADVESLEVRRGEGGLKSLSGPEKVLARSNALGSLDADDSPRISFAANEIEESGDGYRLVGSLEIKGRSNPCTVDLRVEDLGTSWRMTSETVVRQSDFGVKPYSLMLGALKVSDDVTVAVTAERAKRG